MPLRFAERPSGSPVPIATIVLIHGLGADENDLLPFADFLDERLQVMSIRAPREYEWGGYSWFDVDIGGQAMRVDLDQFNESLQLVAQFLSDLGKPVFLCGFSQGAMMAIGILLEHPQLVSGVVAMSGGLLPYVQPVLSVKPPLLMTHGTHDPVVPFEFGELSARQLREIGIEVEFRRFEMGHEVTGECLSTVSDWLNTRVNESVKSDS